MHAWSERDDEHDPRDDDGRNSGWGASRGVAPTECFTILEPQNPSIDVSELH